MSDEPKLKVGSRVVLKSGGPTMTVYHINATTDDSGDQQVLCVWMHKGEPRWMTIWVGALDIIG